MKTLRSNNGSMANLGNVQVQPLGSQVAQAQAGKQLTSPSTKGVPPTSEVHLAFPTLTVTTDAVTRTPAQSLSDVGSRLGSDPGLVIPLQSSVNTLMPSYHIGMGAGKEYDPRFNQGFVTTTTKFQPYEQLTGISQERPEVVMVTSFEPLFNLGSGPSWPKYDSGDPVAWTNAGMFLEAQCATRDLMTYNVQTLVKTLRTRYPIIDQQFTTRQNNFSDALNKLNVDVTFLLNVVRVLETQKEQLDLRHDIYTVNPTEAGNLLLTNYTQAQVQSSVSPTDVDSNLKPSPPNQSLTTRHKPQYGFVDTLGSLGYNTSTVQDVYASSKVWLQTLYELSNALKYHTLQFLDIDPTFQRNDTSPTTILNPKVTRFSLSTSLPDLPSLTELVNLQPGGAQNAISLIKPAFQTIYQNVSFKDEEARITALAHLLSAEYRYSYGLTQPSVIRQMSDFYGYTVSPNAGNSGIFDSIIGKFGNNITDFPLQATNALTSIAQLPAGPSGILTFESKYVEGDTGTLSPGGDYFFGDVLQTTGQSFNTTQLDFLVPILQNAQSSFNVIIDSLNLLSQPVKQRDDKQLTPGSIMTTTMDLLNAVKTHLVNGNGQTSKMLQSDRLASVFAQARKDDGVKASLFLYVLAKVSRSYSKNVPFLKSSNSADNTALVNYLINQVNDALEASLPTTRSAVQVLNLDGAKPFSSGGSSAPQVNSPYALNPDGVAAALKAGTALTTYIEQLMSQVIADLQVNTHAISSNNLTQYSGYLNTIVMMVAFDMITSMVARYGSVDLVGISTNLSPFSKTDPSYVVSSTTIDHRNSINELSERALGEDTRVQQMILTVTNTLSVLGGSVKGVSNYLKSPASDQRLQEVAGFLDNNAQLVQMLLSEQQIMMFAAQVENLLAAVNQSSSSSSGNKDSHQNEQIKILDESQIPDEMKKAMLAYLGTGDFASSAAANKRILTVGIPQGFVQRIKQVVSIQQQKRASFQNRRSDLVYVCVYKVDMVNSDIIYKPLKFLFELSRFPVRLSTTSWLPLPQNPDLSDIVNCVPTLSFSDNADTNTSTAITDGIEYASATVAGNDGVKNVAVALSDDTYSFLTANQKTQVLQNHVTSQLLEVYIKLMTGLNVAEYCFDMPPPAAPTNQVATAIDGSFVGTLVASTVQHVTDMVSLKTLASSGAPTGGVLFSTTNTDPKTPVTGGTTPIATSQPQSSNASGVAGNISTSSQVKSIKSRAPAVQTLSQSSAIGDIQTNLLNITPRYVPLVQEAFRTLSSFSNLLSNASAVSVLNHQVVNPKQFDRVFNVVVDPTIFLVDVQKTTSTPYGKAALEQMIQNGEIVSATENDIALASTVPISTFSITPGSRPFPQGRASPNVNAYRYRDRDISQGDLIADKYFITIETLDEGT